LALSRRAAAVGASAGRKASSRNSETVTSAAVAKLVIVVHEQLEQLI
jgi:hypothetical protein